MSDKVEELIRARIDNAEIKRISTHAIKFNSVPLLTRLKVRNNLEVRNDDVENNHD